MNARRSSSQVSSDITMPSSFSRRRSAILSATQRLMGHPLSLGFRINEMSPSIVEEFCILSNRLVLYSAHGIRFRPSSCRILRAFRKRLVGGSQISNTKWLWAWSYTRVNVSSRSNSVRVISTPVIKIARLVSATSVSAEAIKSSTRASQKAAKFCATCSACCSSSSSCSNV